VWSCRHSPLCPLTGAADLAHSARNHRMSKMWSLPKLSPTGGTAAPAVAMAPPGIAARDPSGITTLALDAAPSGIVVGPPSGMIDGVAARGAPTC